MKYNVKDIADKIEVKEKDILNVYMIGSRVYGTDSFSSDYDYVVVTSTDLNNREYRRGELNIHVYNKEHFQEKLNQQKVQFIEAFLSPIKLKEEYSFYWNLDRARLVQEFSMNSDETFSGYLKARFEDKYLAYKKLFHSIRLLIFGLQILKFGKITDFSAANPVWEELFNYMHFDTDITKYNNFRKELKKRVNEKETTN
jgi:predicted nucleotidyltransferase